MVKCITGWCGARIFARWLARSAALTWSFVRSEQPTDQPRHSSGLQTQSQVGYPKQVVGPRHEISPGLRPFYPTISSSPQTAYRLHPAKDFFYPFADRKSTRLNS